MKTMKESSEAGKDRMEVAGEHRTEGLLSSFTYPLLMLPGSGGKTCMVPRVLVGVTAKSGNPRSGRPCDCSVTSRMEFVSFKKASNKWGILQQGLM